MPGLAGRRSVPGSMSRLTAALDRFPWLKTAREAALFAHRRGREVRLQQVAGSLTFTTVLSIVPLFAVALALFSVFPYFADFREAFQSLVQRTLPAQISSTVLRYLGEFAQQATRLTAAGLIFLGLTALAMIMTVDRVLNDIWQVHERRPLSQRVLIYWAIITLGPIVIGASLTASSYLWSLSEDAIMRTPGWLRRLIDYAPVVLSGFAYAALYVFVPNRTVRWRDALIGGFVAALLAEVLKSAFGYFIGRGAVRSIYGAFAALPLFLLWMYLSWYTLLFGAAIAATLPRMRATRFSDELRAGNTFVTALALIRQSLNARRSGNAAVGGQELARGARTDLAETERLLESLERLGYVRRLSAPRKRGESSEWILTCDPQTTSLRRAYERFAIDPANTSACDGSRGRRRGDDRLDRARRVDQCAARPEPAGGGRERHQLGPAQRVSQTDRRGSVAAEHLFSQRVGAAVEVAVQGLPEQRLLRRDGGEQRHRRMEFQVVGRSENLVHCLVADVQHKARALAQPRSEHRMREISLGLGTAREAEVLGHRAATEAPQLRKDEPHPVARLRAGGKLGTHTLVDRSLCDDEALEVERHSSRHRRSAGARTGSSRSGCPCTSPSRRRS